MSPVSDFDFAGQHGRCSHPGKWPLIDSSFEFSFAPQVRFLFLRSDNCSGALGGKWKATSRRAAVTQMATVPRGADPHHLKKVLPVTLQRYRESLRPFVAFLLQNRFPRHSW